MFGQQVGVVAVHIILILLLVILVLMVVLVEVRVKAAQVLEQVAVQEMRGVTLQQRAFLVETWVLMLIVVLVEVVVHQPLVVV
jgi:hypothetical protein